MGLWDDKTIDSGAYVREAFGSAPMLFPRGTVGEAIWAKRAATTDEKLSQAKEGIEDTKNNDSDDANAPVAPDSIQRHSYDAEGRPRSRSGRRLYVMYKSSKGIHYDYTTSDEEEHRQNEGIEDTKNNLSAVGQLLMMSKERSGPVMKRPAAAADVICDTSKRSCLSAAGHRDNQRPAVTH